MADRPESLDEWKAYIGKLAGENLRSKTIGCNRQAFVSLMLADGYSMAGIRQIMVALVKQMKTVGMLVPSGGAFNLVGMAEVELQDVKPLPEDEVFLMEADQPVDPSDNIDSFVSTEDLIADWGEEVGTPVIKSAGSSPIIHRFPGEENTEYRVIRLQNGKFSVTLYDQDAQETLPWSKRFPTETAALGYAEKLARRSARSTTFSSRKGS